MKTSLCAVLAALVGSASADVVFPDAVTLTPDAPAPFSSAYHGIEATLQGVQSVGVQDGRLPFGTALSLTGLDSSCVRLGRPEALDMAGEMAVSAWICPFATDGLRNIVCRGFRFAPNREVYLRLANGRLEFGIWGNADCAASAPYTIPVRKWAFVSGTFTGHSFDLYLNGVRVASVASSVGPEVFDADWCIGRHPQNGQRPFVGLVGDVTFHGGALDADQAELLYLAGTNGVHAAGVKRLRTSADAAESEMLEVDGEPPALALPRLRRMAYVSGLRWSFASADEVSVADDRTDRPAVWWEDFAPVCVPLASGGGMRRYVRAWRAEDDAANFAVGDEVVEIVKDSRPRLAMPPEATVAQGASVCPAATGEPVCEDDDPEFPTRIAYEDVFDSALGVGLALDRLSSAQSVDASGGGASVLRDFDVVTSNAFSLAATVRLGTFTTNATIRTVVSKGPRFSPAYEVYLRVVGATYVFGYWNGYDYAVSAPADAADAGSEVSLAGTFDGRTLRLYRNGVLAASRRLPLGFVQHRPLPWGIGRPSSDGYGDRCLDGEIVRLGIWSRCLSGSECAMLARLSRVPSGAAAFCASRPSADGTRTIWREWTAEDAFGNVTNAFQRLVVTGAFEDGDGDGLCGYLEEVYGTDAGSPDTDADGLSDGVEVFASFSDPLVADTDGDRLPDAWEYAHRFDPLDVAETYQDTDQDGLVNLVEFWRGTDPRHPDSDGDGVADGMEFFSAVSNPSVGDFSGEAVPLGKAFAPADFASSAGQVRCDEGEVYSAASSGELTWDLVVPDGSDALAFEVAADQSRVSRAGFTLVLSVDGKFAGQSAVYFGGPTRAVFYLPDSVSAGAHAFTLAWHAHAKSDGAYLRLAGMTFMAHPRTGSAVAALSVKTLNDYVSPACLEARTPYRATFAAWADGRALEARLLPNFGFSVNVDLPADGAVREVVCSDGVVAVTSAVAWAACPVGTVSNLMIRAGDALRLTGAEAGETTLAVARVDGIRAEERVEVTVSEPWVHVFTNAGTYRVSAQSRDSSHAEMRVEVVSSAFPQPVLLTMQAEARTLDCPGLDARCDLEVDEMLKVTRTVEGLGARLSVAAPLAGDYALATRLPDGGAVCDALRVTPLHPDNGLYYSVIETYPDGTELVEVQLWLSHLEPGLTVECEAFVAGVTLENGLARQTYTADDFDGTGHLAVRFLKSPGVKTSVCHRTFIYQDGKEIYNNRWR